MTGTSYAIMMVSIQSGGGGAGLRGRAWGDGVGEIMRASHCTPLAASATLPHRMPCKVSFPI